MNKKNLTFNEIILKLNTFWQKHNCIILQPINKEVGAATYHPTTFINAIKNNKWNAAYTQICKRPSDLQSHAFSNKNTIFHQYQVIMQPSPINIKNLYLDSLNYININDKENEIKFIEDNWQSPTLGAFGIGWEIRLNGTEITQFTYFQQMGSIECKNIMVEIAYGLERLAMHIQNKNTIDKIIIEKKKHSSCTYSDLYTNYQKEIKIFYKNIKYKNLKKDFFKIEKLCEDMINKNLPRIAYDYIIDLSNIFNTMEIKKNFQLTERQLFVQKLKTLTHKIAINIKNEKQQKNFN